MSFSFTFYNKSNGLHDIDDQIVLLSPTDED